MQFRLFTLLMLFVLVGCSTKKSVSTEVQIPKIKYSKLAKAYGSASFKNADFKTVKIDAKLFYKSEKNSQKLGLSFRIAKGEKIWISGSFLGIPVVKALIEQNKIQYYNKFNKTYFEGSFDFVKQLLGVDVTYETLEKILMADLVLDIDHQRFKVNVANQSYFISDTDNKKYNLEASLYPFTFKTKHQAIKQKLANSFFNVDYNTYQEVNGFLFPKELNMIAQKNDKKSVIELKYNDVKFNEQLSFPYKVPKDCDKRIVLKTNETNKINE